MPYTLKTSQISVKDPETGEYSGVDILAEQTEQGLIAELQAEGTTQVNRINQAAVDVQAAVDQAESDAATIISDTQTSINTLEAQKNTIAQTVASMAELGTDTTLSTPGMAADAGAVGDLSRQLSDAESAIKFSTGAEAIEIEVLNKYLKIVNNVIDVDNPQMSSTGYGYVIVSCVPGDMFVVNGVSSNTEPMAWAFTDDSYGILEKAASNVTVTNAQIEAPDNAAYLVIHDKSPYRLSYKGIALQEAVRAIESDKVDKFTSADYDIPNKRVYIGGDIDTSNNDNITNFIRCTPGTIVEWYGRSFWYNNHATMNCVAFYTEEKQFISGEVQVDGSTATTNQVGKIVTTAPDNTAFVVGSDHTISGVEAYLHIYDIDSNIRIVPELEASVKNKLESFYSAAFSKSGYRYDYHDKAIVGYANGRVTDYVPCSAGDAIKYIGTSFYYNNNPYMYCVAFLADDYSFISGVVQVDGNDTTLSANGTIDCVAPEGTAYVIGSNNGLINTPSFHVYSYEQILSKDDTKREDRKKIVKKIKMARHIKGDYTQRVTFLHFSDLHKDVGALSRIGSDRVFYGKYIDDIICTGDMVDDQYETAEEFATWWNPSVMLCIGNHDVAKNENGVYDWAYLSMADRASTYISPYVTGWGVTQESGKSYFYKDYDSANLRLIVLDVMLYNLSGNEASEQETWLTNLLADAITNNKHVLIACHSPHGGAEAEECSFSRVGQTTMSTRDDCNTPQAIIDIVATKITVGLHFCGYLVGHMHQDNMWDAEDDGKQLMYCVTTSRVNNKDYWGNSDQHRDATLDAYNIVTVDTRNTLVKIIRGGGANSDDHMRSRDMICFDYTTGEIVGEVT